MSEIRTLYKSLNLDEFDDPCFQIRLAGKNYPARIVSFQDLIDLQKHEDGLAAGGVELDSFAGMQSRIGFIFPDLPKEMIPKLSFVKCAAILRDVINFFNETLQAATGGLESFRKGEAEENHSTSPK